MTKRTKGRPPMGLGAARARFAVLAAVAWATIGLNASSARGMDAPAFRFEAARTARPSADTVAGSDTLSAPKPPIEARAESDAVGSDLPSDIGFGMRYHSLLAPSMRDTYDHAISTTTEQVWRGHRLDAFFEIGWLTARGTPPRLDSEWDVLDTWVEMKVLALDLDVHYRLRDTGGDALFEPYVGAGPVLYVGSERISARASRVRAGIEDGFRDELLALRAAVGGAAAVGTTVRVVKEVRLLVETRATLTTSGGTGDLNEEKDNETYASFLYRVVERPSFSFSGWSSYVAIQWSWDSFMR